MKATMLIKNLSNKDYSGFIKKNILFSEGISNIVIDLAHYKITFDYTSHNALEGLKSKLINLGFLLKDQNSILCIDKKLKLDQKTSK
ncbi:hypothetical protein [Aquimarina litoralis]|uniref:hypothetical protein n=1 Tax=Aquimarina litoralis TaxID=584605 RepID=UPI001C57E792|nr:hypothetical protein [Aquimarina litoralis]MBW1298921.1 hypothetical protein [Aquimarina litoralis]